MFYYQVTQLIVANFHCRELLSDPDELDTMRLYVYVVQ